MTPERESKGPRLGFLLDEPSGTITRGRRHIPLIILLFDLPLLDSFSLNVSILSGPGNTRQIFSAASSGGLDGGGCMDV